MIENVNFFRQQLLVSKGKWKSKFSDYTLFSVKKFYTRAEFQIFFTKINGNTMNKSTFIEGMERNNNLQAYQTF